MIYKQNNRTILRMVQGDTEDVTAMLLENGVASTFASGDVVTLTAEKIGSGSNLFTPVTATATSGAEAVVLTIPASATSGLEPGEFDYEYDVSVTFAAGGTKHIVERSPFVLVKKVGVAES